MNFLKKYVKQYWKLFSTAVGFLTVEALCDLTQPTIMSKIIDIGVKNKDINYVIKLGLLMLLVTLIGALAASTRNILATNVSQKFGRDLRNDLYKKINGFSFENLDRFHGESLITRLTNDVTQVQNFTNGLMRIFVKAPLLCIGSFIMMVRLNGFLSSVLLVVIPIVGIIIAMNMKIGYPYFRRIQQSLDKVNGIVREYLSGVRVVKAFNRFDYEEKRFKVSNDELSDISTTAMRIMSIFSPGIALTVNFGIVAVIWLGGIRVNGGHMQVGQIIAFTNYMTQILFSLMMISNVFTMFVRARASAERIEEVFQEENTIDFIKSSKEATVLEEDISKIKGTIEFQDVSFSYKGFLGEPVLKNITFSCTSGETVGIIGSTGSGKSSLINLIPRFYDATEGSVRIDGVDVKNIEPRELREKISVVSQKAVLFTGSIIDNIRWGKEAASIEEVKEASVMAEADEFIMNQEKGYNTMLGQGGVNLSGGQKQRVSIARALIRQPEILILDDSTSAVDASTETKIKENLKAYSKNLTTILIAQRITSVMDCDKIIILDNGRIDSIGTHEELMKESNVYKDIFNSQIGEGVN